MKKQLHLIIIMLMFGFFLPTSTYACGTKTEKSCCKKETTSKPNKKECCNDSKSKDEDNSCGGKCGHSNCTSASSINFSLISTFEIDFDSNTFVFSPEKQTFYNSKTFISSGFSSVWLIPKIS